MKLRTLKAWNKRNRRISKGERAAGWKLNKKGKTVALFTKSQTYAVQTLTFFNHRHEPCGVGWDSARDHNDGMDPHLWFDYH